VQIFSSHLLAGGEARHHDFCSLLLPEKSVRSDSGAWQNDDAFFY
jgi:hypothetical protein